MKVSIVKSYLVGFGCTHMFTGSTQPLRTSQDPTDKNTKTKTVRYLYIHLEELLSC